jgi:FeS assembly SUF system protein
MTTNETAVADATQAAAGDATLRDQVIDALRTVYDPEIPVNIYELGLIYDIAIDENGAVAIEMTLTAPGCPVAGSMPGTVQEAVAAVPGVSKVDVELVWDPPWDQSRMSEAAQLELGMI